VVKENYMSIKSAFVKGELQKPHIIRYVLDDYGYKKGVIVAFGEDKIGWAMVAPADYCWKKERLHNVPVVAHSLREGKTWDQIITTPIVQRILNRGLLMNAPIFDKESGLTKAVHRALAGRTAVIESPVQTMGSPTVYVAKGDMIQDEDLEIALYQVKERLNKAKFAQK
jgi:hypothetical protein